jgi:HAD superfamily hydrolase (TIGR01509 family)
MSRLKALIFDCDGVLAETERDGHRVAFNKAFRQAGLDAEWSVEEYGELVKISGGKERMKSYFKEKADDEKIAGLHKLKTGIFMEMSEAGQLPGRTGIKRIIKEAHDAGLMLFVCSTSNEKSVSSLLKANVGEEYFSWFTELFCGDIVKAKKPAPDIYNLVKDKYNLLPDECFVVEDSRNGLLAAKAAGMNCIVTPSFYSAEEDFSEADIVVSSLGDPGTPKITVIKSNPRLTRDAEYITVRDLIAIA